MYLCNKYNVIWSGSEDSSHVIPCLCALFLWEFIMKNYFDVCIEEAKKSLDTGDVPIGAILVKDKKIIAFGHNTREKEHNILGHAEINVIKDASKILSRWNLADCELYVTLEPCSMCKEVIKQARIKKVYYLLTKLSFKKEYDRTNFEKIGEENELMYAKILADFFKKFR